MKNINGTICATGAEILSVYVCLSLIKHVLSKKKFYYFLGVNKQLPTVRKSRAITGTSGDEGRMPYRSLGEGGQRQVRSCLAAPPTLFLLL
jgi:hypothetical protein